MSDNAKKDRIAFGALVVFYVGWALYLIDRTAVEHEGLRYFTLWDDAMISMRYAKNLASGAGLVWNPGERIMGFSNLGVTLLMVPVHWLPVGARHTSLVVQLVCLAITLANMAAAAKLVSLVFGDDPWMPRATILLLAACAPFQILSLQGTDIPFVTFVLLGALVLAVRAMRKNEPWPVTLWLLLAIGIVIRIDVAIFFVALLFFCFRAPEPGSRRQAALGGALLAVVLAALLAWTASYYGDPLPNTYYLKATGQPRLLMVISGVSQVGPLLARLSFPLLLTVVGIKAFYWKDRAVRLVVAMAGIVVAYHVWVGENWIAADYVSRFLAPALPLFIVLLVGVTFRITGAIALRMTESADEAPRALDAKRRVDVFFLMIILAVPSLGTQLSMAEWIGAGEPMHVAEKHESLALATWLTKNAPKTTSVAVHWGGIQPYFSGYPQVDVLGKCDRHIAHLTVDRFEPGHSKWDWLYVVNERKPDVIDAESRGLRNVPAFAESYCRRDIAKTKFYIRRDVLASMTDAEPCVPPNK